MKRRFLVVVFSVLVNCTFFSCKENAILNNTDLVPIVDNINTFFNDTSTLITNSIFKDSLVTSATRYMAVGCMQDPSFGRTNAQFALDFSLPQLNYNLSGDTLHVADSAILYIPYSATYGNRKTTSQQSVVVYRLTDTLYSDTMYNNEKVAYDNSKLIGIQSVDFNNSFGTDDSVTINKIKLEPGLYIKLEKSFADELIAQNKTDNFKDHYAFRKWLKGLYISVADTTNGDNIAYFNIAAARLALYYRGFNKDTLTKVDTFFTSFPVNQLYCKNYNYITRNYSSSFVENYINSSATDSLVMLQSEPGLITTVTIPNYSAYQNYVINRAELLLNVVASNKPQFDSLFAKPGRLQALVNHSDGSGDKIPSEYAIWGTNDGYITKTYLNGDSVEQYRINITRTLQNSIITGQPLTIKLFGIREGYFAKNRVVLGGSTHSKYPAKLNIIYTKIKK